MEVKLTIAIDEQLCEYLERMHYLVNSELNVIKYMLESKGSLENNPAWDYYYSKYMEDSIEYNMVKTRVSEEIRPIVEEQTGIANLNFNWEVRDFKECLINIMY